MPFFRRKSYRFFYPAGLISLALLPLLSIFYLRFKVALQQQYVIPYLYSNDDSRPPEQLRNYITVEIGKNPGENNDLLSEAQSKIRQLSLDKDKINGIQFIFRKESKYNDLIQILNICLKENVNFIPEREHLWVLFTGLPLADSPTFEELIFYNWSEKDVVIPDPIFSFLRVELLTSWRALKFQFQEFVTQLQHVKPFWPIGILYLIMVALTARKVVNQLQYQQRTTSNQQL